MNKEKKHRLLRRQLSRFNIDLDKNPELELFVNDVNKTYEHFDQELKINDTQTAKMMSKMTENNQNLQNIIDTIDSFNYHVSHDLKTSIINNISLTRMLNKYINSNKTEKIEELVSRLIKNSNNGLHLIEKYLEISKFESKLIDAPKFELNVKDIALDILSEIQLEGQLTVKIEEKDFDSIYMDELSLKSLLQNFMTNAYKYRRLDTKPELEILLSKEDAFKVLSLKDNGIGIDMKRHGDNLFKPFVRVDTNIEGTGVGLFIIKKIITKLGGSIEVESELKKGTTFTIKIPDK